MKQKKGKQPKMQEIALSLKDWQDAMRGNVYRNRKKYTRKLKHRNDEKYVQKNS